LGGEPPSHPAFSPPKKEGKRKRKMCPQERKKRNRKKEKGQESSFFFPFKFFFSLTPTRKARSRSAHLISQRKRQAKNYPFLKSSHTTEVVQKRERERRVFASFSVQAYTPSRQAAKRRGKVVTKLLTPASSPPHTHTQPLSLFFFLIFLSLSLFLSSKKEEGREGGKKRKRKEKRGKWGGKGEGKERNIGMVVLGLCDFRKRGEWGEKVYDL